MKLGTNTPRNGTKLYNFVQNFTGRHICIEIRTKRYKYTPKTRTKLSLSELTFQIFMIFMGSHNCNEIRDKTPKNGTTFIFGIKSFKICTFVLRSRTKLLISEQDSTS